MTGKLNVENLLAGLQVKEKSVNVRRNFFKRSPGHSAACFHHRIDTRLFAKTQQLCRSIGLQQRFSAGQRYAALRSIKVRFIGEHLFRQRRNAFLSAHQPESFVRTLLGALSARIAALTIDALRPIHNGIL